MEPMTLGSPGSPQSPNSSAFLPSFLTGESNIQTTPRNNTLSPNKGRMLAFANRNGGGGGGVGSSTGTINSPNDYCSPILQQKTMFGYHQTPGSGNNSFSMNHQNLQSIRDHHHQQQLNNSSSVAGPPKLGLFDALTSEKHKIAEFNAANSMPSTNINQSSIGGGGLHQADSFNQSQQHFNFNESYFSQNDLTTSRLMSSPTPTSAMNARSNGGGYDYQQASGYRDNNNQLNDSGLLTQQQQQSSFWITVFGFPQTAINAILTHFSQCGTIVEKHFPSHVSNCVHLKFTSRLECDKAINYNERIVGNLMVGVVYCKDPAIVDKENIEKTSVSMNRVRPLAHIAYKNAQIPSEVISSPPIPKRNAGIVNKAMDMFFGW